MTAEIYVGDPNSEPLRTTTEYEKNRVALALAGKGQGERFVGGLLELDLADGYRVLINPATVTFIREVSP